MVSLKVLPIVLILILISFPVQAHSDPYLVQGKAQVNGEPIEDLEVTLIYDRTGTKYTDYTDSNGIYVIQLQDYKEGDTYTLSAKGLTATGKIIVYDSDGYQRQGDIIDIEPENKVSDPPIILLIFLIIITLLMAYLGVKEREK